MTDQQAAATSSFPRATRKTRFVCISDTHNASPNGSFKLPKGDVLIHAGDLTNQGSFSELRKTIGWLEEADFEAKIIVAGNHDITLDADFYAQYGLYFHNQDPQDPAKCVELLERSSSITWLKHEATTVKLTSPGGPQTVFKIFGSPFSPAMGMWAFGYGPEKGENLWDQIPLDSDMVVTHTPPKYHCDERRDRRAAGCEALRSALWRVRPRVAICGHVHEGRGAEVVRWDLAHSNIKYKEVNVERWEDPGSGNKKTSLVDLSSKGKRAIDNDGSRGNWHHASTKSPRKSTPDSQSPPTKSILKLAGEADASTCVAIASTEALQATTKGQGGIPPSQRCDLEALSGRLGRRETCIINAAIMASSWPHGAGGKRFNKPIVVDIDLPVWDR